MTTPHDLARDAAVPGMSFEPIAFGPLTRADIVRYAGASGDFNPIHIDDDYARSAGAPGVFAMGMLPAGYLAHALSDWVGGPQWLRRFKVRFTTRVWPGDELVCSGTIVSVDDGVARVALEARRRGNGPAGLELPDDELAIVGEADVELPQ
jgi:acyl dehydratase